MSFNDVGTMVAISMAVSSAMAFVVSLMIRSAIAEASNKISGELHTLVQNNYVGRREFDVQIAGLKVDIAAIVERID